MEEHAYSPPSGYISIYEECFRARLRFFLHPFFVILFHFLEISLSSVVLNSWQYICSFTMVCVLAGVGPSITLFRYYFTLKRHLRSRRWWYVTSRNRKNTPLIRGAPSIVHSWKGRFLFVTRSLSDEWSFVNLGEPQETVEGSFARPTPEARFENLAQLRDFRIERALIRADSIQCGH